MSMYEYTVLLSQSPGAAQAKDPQQRHVLVEPLPDECFRVIIDGVESIVSARKVETAGAAATYSLLGSLPGRSGSDAAPGASSVGSGGAQRMIDIDPAATGDELRVTVDGGEPLFVQVHDLRDRLAVSGELGGSGAAGDLRAAMPGKVVKLLSKVGDAVKAGQSLLVIEAMKMENELRSPGAGRITEIGVREGQTVEAGQLLVALASDG